MEQKEIRAALIGTGGTGAAIIRYMAEKGVTIVGAADLYRNHGRDIGEVGGIAPLGVPVEKDAGAMMARVKPDIAVVCTASEMRKVYPVFKLCLENGANVISVAEEAFWPYYTAPELAAELDALAKAKGVSLLGTGVQDVFWYSWGMSAASAVNGVRGIHGDCLALIDDFGPATADECFVGKTLSEYEKAKAGETDEKPRAFTVALYNMADALALHVVSRETFSRPILSPRDIYCEALDRRIPKGCLLGVDDGARLDTEEGIALTGVIHDRVRVEPGERETTSWRIEGEFTLEVSTGDTNGIKTGMITLVNRIPDVINAEPGFRLVRDLPHPCYRPRPLPTYVTRQKEER